MKLPVDPPRSSTRGRVPREILVVGVALLLPVIMLTGCSTDTAAGPPTASSKGPRSIKEPAAASVPVTPSAAPTQGSAFFAGSANVPVSFSVPSGWEVMANAFVLKSGAEPAYGVGFFDVANIYRKGCRWALLDPPVGTTVDDLVAAYRKVPELRPGPAKAVTVDSFRGKQFRFTVPDYRQGSCKDDTFALVQADNAGANRGSGNVPNLWAQAPGQQLAALVLDVDGTRLVIYSLYPATVSPADIADIEEIVSSIKIG